MFNKSMNRTKETMARLKKTALVSLLTLCLLSLPSLTGYKAFVKAQNRTWTVGYDRPADFTSIQEAVNSNNVDSNDTILVYKGVYNESVEISKTVNLIGEDRESTNITGDTSSDFVISISASNVNLKNFTIQKSGAPPFNSGIQLVSSGSEVSHNNIINIYDGILMFNCGNNLVSDNVILGCSDTGISLIYFSIGNRFIGNTISNGQNGISLSFSKNNLFTANTVSNNQQGASISSQSTQNKFYDNNFINNTNQAMTDGSFNSWSINGEGNYWSNYNGSDTSQDGIGDEPYTIDASNVDGAPLLGTFNSFNAVSAEKEYQVTIVGSSTISDFTFEIGLETGNKVIRFATSGQDGTVGFCRVSVPTGLMNYSLLLVSGDEVTPTPLSRSNSTQVYLYFTYLRTNQIVTIISSETLNMLRELTNRFTGLQEDMQDLNSAYSDVLNSYSTLLSNYGDLQLLLLQLNTTYRDHLSKDNDNLQNIRSLMYVFAGVSAVFIATTIYLSSRLHTRKTKTTEEKK